MEADYNNAQEVDLKAHGIYKISQTENTSINFINCLILKRKFIIGHATYFSITQ